MSHGSSYIWGGMGMVSQARPLQFLNADCCTLIMEVIGTEEQKGPACNTRNYVRGMACVVHESTSPSPPCLQRKLVPHLMSCCSVSWQQQTDLPHSYCAGSTLQDDIRGNEVHQYCRRGMEGVLVGRAGHVILQPTCTLAGAKSNRSKARVNRS